LKGRRSVNSRHTRPFDTGFHLPSAKRKRKRLVPGAQKEKTPPFLAQMAGNAAKKEVFASVPKKKRRGGSKKKRGNIQTSMSPAKRNSPYSGEKYVRRGSFITPIKHLGTHPPSSTLLHRRGGKANFN